MNPRIVIFLIILCFHISPRLVALQLNETENGPYKVYRLENNYWRFEVVPELGGKVISLKDMKTGREWLWSSDQERQLTSRTRGAHFGQENLIGMDELLPSLEKETVLGYTLPGHGEVWQRSVKIDIRALDRDIITTYLELDSIPVAYIRTISLHGSTIRFDYTLINHDSKPLPYLWAQHPLFNIQEGDQLTIDFGEFDLEVKAAPGLPNFSKDAHLRWPGHDQGIDLSRLALGTESPAGIKLIGLSPRGEAITLSNSKSDAKLQIRYDRDALPWLAIWLSRGVWDGAHHLAIEPTNRPGESIRETSSDPMPTGLIPPDSRKTWWVEFTNASEP